MYAVTKAQARPVLLELLSLIPKVLHRRVRFTVGGIVLALATIVLCLTPVPRWLLNSTLASDTLSDSKEQ